MLQLHAAAELARAQAQEGDAVAMIRIHVGLDLEHEAGDLVLGRVDGARLGRLRARRRRPDAIRVEQFAHAEIAEGAAEEHRRQMAGAIRVEVERGTASAHQLDSSRDLAAASPDRVICADRLAHAMLRSVARVAHQHARSCAQIVGALEVRARCRAASSSASRRAPESRRSRPAARSVPCLRGPSC